MIQREYSASAVKLSFWFIEFKKLVYMLNDGLSYDGIRQKSIDENVFSASSPERAVTIFNTVSARVKDMPESFIPMFVGADVGTQKIFCLMACMCHDTLFFEFVYDVVRDKMILCINSFEDRDMRIFFENKQQQSDRVAGWTDCALKRLGMSYKTMLLESGLCDRDSVGYRIHRPILGPDIETWMRGNGLTPVWKALEGIA